MTNYYEELNLNKDASPAELMEELIRLEAVWHKREISRPDAAAEKLVLITQAKKVFASAAAKAKYDRALFAAPAEDAPEDPDAERRAQYMRWHDQAADYFNSGQYDLAKTAVERAMNYVVGEDDTEFFCLASMIYRRNNDLATAMSYVNKAIVSDPQNGFNYLLKGQVYEQQFLEASRNRYSNGNPAELLRQEREMFQRAEQLAAQAGENIVRGRARGCQAFSLYYQSPKDAVLAEQYAREALELGDDWGNAQKVLDELQAARDKEYQAIYSEALRKKGTGNEIYALEAAIQAFQPIAGWRDVDGQIQRCRERIEELREQAAAAQAAAEEEARRKKKRKRRVLTAVLILALLATAITLPAVYLHKHKAGDNISWKLRDGVLTLSGTGAMDYTERWKDDWDTYRSVRSVVIGEGVTLVKSDAFASNENLTSVSLPDGLVKIENYAFGGSGLTEVELPASLREIGGSAFNCPYLETVTFRGTVAEWNAIERDEEYEGSIFGETAVTVRCTDGELYY